MKPKILKTTLCCTSLQLYLRHHHGQGTKLRENRSKAAAAPDSFGSLQALLSGKAGASRSQKLWIRKPELETEIL